MPNGSLQNWTSFSKADQRDNDEWGKLKANPKLLCNAEANEITPPIPVAD